MSAYLKYHWDFGDGETSDEIAPKHVYKMPGEYTAMLTVTTLDGTTASFSLVIYVYETDYSGDSNAPHVAYSDRCYRNAVTRDQGVAIVEWGGVGWIWPEAHVGACQGFDKGNNAYSVIMDNLTGRHFRIGVENYWRDKEDDYTFYDIPGRVKLPEKTSRAGEYEFIELVEGHAYFRPFDAKKRNHDGYDANGYLVGFEAGLNLFKNGEPFTPNTRARNIPLMADITVPKRIKDAKRLQVEIVTNMSGWKLVGVQQHIEEKNIKGGPLINTKSERVWQREFAGQDFWLSRSAADPLMNRATGTRVTGTYDALVTGPDGIPRSAMAFAAAQGLTIAPPALSGDFSLFIWLHSMAAFPGIIWQLRKPSGADLRIRIDSAGGVQSLVFNDGINNITLPMTWDGVSWELLTIERLAASAQLRMYENAILRASQVMTNSGLPYGGAGSRCINGAVVEIYDPRRVPRAVSREAIEYYYNDVIQNAGNGGLIPVMR